MCFNHHSVTVQPQANQDLGSLDFKQSITDEKLENSHHHHCQCEHESFSEHHSRRHNIRSLRRFLLPAIFVFVALIMFLAWSCPNGKMPAWGVDLVGRGILDNSTTASSSSNPFVDHKLYLIVIFVGLVVILISAILLVACCCKQSFQNPCCCPCYLFACCGGLACLECLCCGLCLEGLSEVV